MAAHPDEFIGELREIVAQEVAGGYLPREDIIQAAVDFLAEEYEPGALRTVAEALTDSTLARHYAAQVSWSRYTDCDRLDAAFQDLESRGIVARQNFSCCQTCGLEEIQDEMSSAMYAGLQVRGYTFFHSQDVESAVQGFGLCLCYGAVEPEEVATAAIAREVVAVLQTHGLAPEWSGSTDKRIVLPLSWQRRRTPDVS